MLQTETSNPRGTSSMSYGGRIPLDPELSWTVIVTVTVAESVLNLNWGARRAASTLKAISGKSNRHKSQMNWNYTKSPMKSWTATQATSKQSSTFDFPLSLCLSPSLDKFLCTTKKKSRNKIRPGQSRFWRKVAQGRGTQREGGGGLEHHWELWNDSWRAAFVQLLRP